jgi:hypothetical protein
VPGPALLATALVLSLHQTLLGLSLGRRLMLTRTERWIAAYFLNDGAYGVTVASRAPTFSYECRIDSSVLGDRQPMEVGGALHRIGLGSQLKTPLNQRFLERVQGGEGLIRHRFPEQRPEVFGRL